MTWTSDTEPPAKPIGWRGAVIAIARGLPVAAVAFGGLAVLLLVRLFERPLYGMRRPMTPFITQFVCRTAFRLMGIGFSFEGTPIRGRGAVVANHTSWLDIFALNAAQQVFFVSKAEVAGWPGIGWLARATGTVFIQRERRQAKTQVGQFEARLKLGHQLLFFPEGTSSDGLQVLPFKTTLFAAFFTPDVAADLQIQPVSVRYHAPEGADPRTYGWWGDMEFGPHLLATLAQVPQGSVRVTYHDPVDVADFADRKALAAYLEARVRDGHARRS